MTNQRFMKRDLNPAACCEMEMAYSVLIPCGLLGGASSEINSFSMERVGWKPGLF